MDGQAQREAMERALRQVLSLALIDPTDGWSDAAVRLAVVQANRAWQDLFETDAPRSFLNATRDNVKALLDAADRDSKMNRDAHAQLLAAGVANYVTGSLLEEGTGPGWQKSWVSVDDDKVRPSHRAVAASGPVPADGKFDVGGHEMFGPGDTSAPIEEWANCRCHAIYTRVQEGEPMVAAANPQEAFVIVGLPADGDSIYAASSDDPPHLTLLYLSTAVLEQAKQILAGEAPKWGPMPVDTDGVEQLGDEGAEVAKVKPGEFAAVRDALLGYEPIKQGFDAVEQFPEWTPHITLGYPDDPAPDVEVPTTILIDRLAIMIDEDTVDSEYPLGEAMTAAAAPPEDDEMLDLSGPYLWDEVPFYGVFAPEGEATGDHRGFDPESLYWEDLPISFRWQKEDQEGHSGSVVTGRIDRIWRDEGLIKYEGNAAMTEDADTMVGLIAEGALRGVSVDLDSTEVEFRNADGSTGVLDEPRIELGEDGQEIEVIAELDAEPTMWVTRGRIRSMAVLPIPAFHKGFIALGRWADHEQQADTPKAGEEPVVTEAMVASAAVEADEYASIDEGPWDGSASKYTDEEWFRATLVHTNGDSRTKSDNKLPVRTPSGKLSRAGVHAAASRIGSVDASPEQIRAAKRALRGLYSQLDEEPPASLTAGATLLAFAPGTQDGPGWLTHPVDTDRLRDYWVHGKGAALIGWGMPGDFNRCRTLLARFVKPQHLAGYCANRHKDALGFWPGEHRGGKHSATVDAYTLLAPSEEALVASGNATLLRPPAEWFDRPPEFDSIDRAQPLVVTEEGRVYAHAAEWGTCHVAYRECVTPPESPSNYAYFRLGDKVTTDGNVPIGVITIGTGHAPLSMDAFNAAAHYDNTGTVVAQVAAGRDEFGIWVAGCIRPGATPEQIDDLRASKLSGDWRPIGGELEMIRVLAVNTPGYPVPRMALAASADGTMERTALVAAGVVESSDERIHRVVAAAVHETLAKRDRVQAMAAIRESLAAKRRRETIAALAARKD